MKNTLTILINEDNEINLELYRTIFKKTSYHTFYAQSGKEGINMAIEIIPNLIFLDIHLPMINGIETFKRNYLI